MHNTRQYECIRCKTTYMHNIYTDIVRLESHQMVEIALFLIHTNVDDKLIYGTHTKQTVHIGSTHTQTALPT